jgi:DNA polymerase (family X)
MSKATKRPRADAVASAQRLADAIRHAAPSVRFEFAGSLRREEQLVGDLDLLLGEDLDLMHRIEGIHVISGGAERLNFIWEHDMPVNVWRVHPGTWGSMLFAVTGPTQYFIWYAKKAQALGLKLSGRGLIDGTGRIIASETEDDIYRALGKEWKHPRLRGK